MIYYNVIYVIHILIARALYDHAMVTPMSKDNFETMIEEGLGNLGEKDSSVCSFVTKKGENCLSIPERDIIKQHKHMK